MTYAIHSVLISTKLPLEEAKKKFQDIVKDKKKKFYRTKQNYYHFRNVPKTKFEKKSFRSKKINPEITMVFGKLKPEHRNKGLEGAGILDWLKDKAKVAKEKIGQVGTAVKEKVGQAVTAVKTFFSPRLDSYNNKSQKTIKEYGNKPITRLQIYRTPVTKVLEGVLNVLSIGKWNEAKKKLGFDEFFHLALVATVEGGKNIIMEKNEVINISTEYQTSSGTQIKEVPIPAGKEITINEMLEKTRQKLGDKDFFQYDAFSLNCQMFIRDLLKSVDLYTPDIDSFLFQDIAKLVKELPSYLGTVARGITDLAGWFNKITGGRKRARGRRVGGAPPPKEEKEMEEKGVPVLTIIDREKEEREERLRKAQEAKLEDERNIRNEWLRSFIEDNEDSVPLDIPPSSPYSSGSRAPSVSGEMGDDYHPEDYEEEEGSGKKKKKGKNKKIGGMMKRIIGGSKLTLVKELVTRNGKLKIYKINDIETLKKSDVTKEFYGNGLRLILEGNDFENPNAYYMITRGGRLYNLLPDEVQSISEDVNGNTQLLIPEEDLVDNTGYITPEEQMPIINMDYNMDEFKRRRAKERSDIYQKRAEEKESKEEEKKGNGRRKKKVGGARCVKPNRLTAAERANAPNELNACFRKGLKVGYYVAKNARPKLQDLPNLTLRQLGELARQWGVRNYGTMRKQQIIDALTAMGYNHRRIPPNA